MKAKAIIIDLDGTLADITHRRKFVEGKVKDWKRFNQNIINDDLNHWCAEIIRRMISDHQILLVSGRTDDLKEETIAWLEKHSVPYHKLHMRKSKDYRDDTVVKKEIFEGEIRPVFDVQFVIDDRAKVVKMWRDAGLVCLQCDWGDF